MSLLACHSRYGAILGWTDRKSFALSVKVWYHGGKAKGHLTCYRVTKPCSCLPFVLLRHHPITYSLNGDHQVDELGLL